MIHRGRDFGEAPFIDGEPGKKLNRKCCERRCTMNIKELGGLSRHPDIQIHRGQTKRNKKMQIWI